MIQKNRIDNAKKHIDLIGEKDIQGTTRLAEVTKAKKSIKERKDMQENS